MSLTAPSASNRYQVTDDHDIGSELWNIVFGSLADRLSSVETAADGFEDAVSDAAIATTQALLTNAVSPQIILVQDILNELQQQAELVNDYIAPLQNGIVGASSVTVASISGLVATTAQGAIAELLAKSNTNGNAIITLSNLIANMRLSPAEALLVSASANLLDGKAYLIVAAGITLTLPASPAAGASIRIIDGGLLSSSTTVALDRNGQTIMDLAENLTIDVTGIDFTIWYNGTTWKLR